LTPGRVYQAMGTKRVYWLTAIEEEARPENESAASTTRHTDRTPLHAPTPAVGRRFPEMEP
jgi:hypothetical protein